MPDLTFAVKLLGNKNCLNATLVPRLRYGHTHPRPQHHKGFKSFRIKSHIKSLNHFQKDLVQSKLLLLLKMNTNPFM